jgi:hypothetical protein
VLYPPELRGLVRKSSSYAAPSVTFSGNCYRSATTCHDTTEIRNRIRLRIREPVRVNLHRHGRRGVSEKVRHLGYGSAPLDQTRGEGVAKRVQRHGAELGV